MAINLKTTQVPNREQRLGTIIRWEGPASELVQDSVYTYGGKKTCGAGKSCGSGGKRLCELESPFTQGNMCTECIAVSQAFMIKGSTVVQHAPIGCAALQSMISRLSRDMSIQRGWELKNPHMLCSNLTEDDMVFGGVAKLEQSIRDAWERHHPKVIIVTSSCAVGVIGDNIDSVTQRLEKELGTIIVPMHCEGFRAKHWSTGFDISGHAILRQLVNKHPKKKEEDLVNVLHLGGPDVYTPLLAKLGLRCNLVMGGATLEMLDRMTSAAASSAMCTVLSYLSAGLEQEYGVPEIKAPTPYGLEATDNWLRDVARHTHREDIVEGVIASEHARIRPQLEALRRDLKGKRGFIAAGATFAHGLIADLKELGVEVGGVMSFHHDPIYDSNCVEQDMLAEAIHNYGDVQNYTVSISQHFQAHAAIKRARPDFIIARHSMGALAARMGVPGAQIRFFNDGVAYDGLIRIGHLIRRTLATGKFSRSLSPHTSVPYKKWWLEQTNPFIFSDTIGQKETGTYD
jgi:nitrogenase molybdenum-iron protein alpha chain